MSEILNRPVYRDMFSFCEGIADPEDYCISANDPDDSSSVQVMTELVGGDYVDEEDSLLPWTPLPEATTAESPPLNDEIPCCFVTPVARVMQWDAFPEFRNASPRPHALRGDWYHHKYQAGKDSCHIHPVLFVSHAWRSTEQPDPDGVDVALLRKMAALMIGMAASRVLELQRQRRFHQTNNIANHNDESPERRQLRLANETMQQVNEIRQGRFRKEEGDTGPIDVYLRAASIGSTCLTSLQLALGRVGNKNAHELQSLERITIELLQPIANKVFHDTEQKDDAETAPDATLVEGDMNMYMSALMELDTYSLEMAVASFECTKGIYVWIDYSSLPQSPRTDREEKYFKLALRSLAHWQRSMCTIVLYQTKMDRSSYHERLWCVVEDICGSKAKIDPQNLLRPGFSMAQDLGVLQILRYLNEMALKVSAQERCLRVTNGSDVQPIMRILGDYANSFDSTALGSTFLSLFDRLPWISPEEMLSLLQRLEPVFWDDQEMEAALSRVSEETEKAVFHSLVDSVQLRSTTLEFCDRWSCMGSPLEDVNLEATRKKLQDRLDFGVRKVFHKFFYIDGRCLMSYIPCLTESETQLLLRVPRPCLDAMTRGDMLVYIGAKDLLRLPQSASQGPLYQIQPNRFARPIPGKTFVHTTMILAHPPTAAAETELLDEWLRLLG